MGLLTIPEHDAPENLEEIGTQKISALSFLQWSNDTQSKRKVRAIIIKSTYVFSFGL